MFSNKFSPLLSIQYDIISHRHVVLQDVILNGHSAAQIITQLHDLILSMDDVTDQQKSTIMERLAVRLAVMRVFFLVVCITTVSQRFQDTAVIAVFIL